MSTVLLIVVTLSRLVAMPFGVSPVGAFALFTGANLTLARAIVYTVLPVLAGFLITGGFHPIVMAAVVVGFALSTLAGRYFLGDQRTLVRGGSAVVVGALTFFLISNGGVWLAGFYPPTLAGLATCLWLGLPFLGIACAVDACYTALMFGVNHWWQQRSANEEPVAAQ